MPRKTADSEGELERLYMEIETLRESQRTAGEAHQHGVALYDSVPLACLSLDALGRISDANPAAIDLLGGREQRVPINGKRLRTLVQGEDIRLLEQHLRRLPTAIDNVICELRLLDGTPVRLWSRRTRAGLRLYPTAIVDLREQEPTVNERRRLLESEHAARTANEAKDQFLAALSHELRTPLTPVLAAVSALRGRAGVPDDLRATCEMIRRNVETEARLIDDLLDVTRIVRRKMQIDRQPVDVHDIARDTLETLAPEIAAKQLLVFLSLEAGHHHTMGDPVRLKQVFWNLVRNAVKFTPDGGRLDLRSWNNHAGDSPRLHVEVSDTGAGFAPEIAPRLFEAFEQGPGTPERSGGLGLGLAICKGVMELHGGQIAANSRGPGLGARFVVQLDTVEPPSVPAALQPAIELRPAHGRQRILLVEDDEDTSYVLAELLADAGYEVSTARTGKAALAANLDGVDLIISDIGLPDTSGLDLMRTLQAVHPMKAVALSGYGTEADIKASTDAGFLAHLTKPVDFDQLLMAIRRSV